MVLIDASAGRKQSLFREKGTQKASSVWLRERAGGLATGAAAAVVAVGLALALVPPLEGVLPVADAGWSLSPRALWSVEAKAQPREITIDRAGAVLLDGEAVTLTELEAQLLNVKARHAAVEVAVRSDAGLPGGATPQKLVKWLKHLGVRVRIEPASALVEQAPVQQASVKLR